MKYTNKYLIALIIVVFLFPGLCFPGDTANKDKKFQVELYNGLSTLNPTDLNLAMEYNRASEYYNYEGRYRAEDILLGDLFDFTFNKEGAFKKLKSGVQCGGRIKYLWNRKLAFSLEFRYVGRSQESNVAFQYNIRALRPDNNVFFESSQTVRTYSPFILSAKAYIPLLGIHYRWLGNPSYSSFVLESYIAGGPMFGSCRYKRGLVHRHDDSDGYWDERTYSYDIKGNGVGFALDCGIRVQVKLYKSIGVFLESGYSYQRAGNISGNGIYQVKLDDQNALGNTQTVTWEGKWVLVPSTFNASVKYPASEYGGSQYNDFKLDMSGFQARIGISFTF
ncbi:MAG: hypothetical protein QG657_1096 [Acidobacteriota bacterium]|nr:hypothetical protein [Acidobacteriota bacterium]